LAFGLCALGATAADRTAAAGRRGHVPPRIRCDKDGDGALSRAEWPFSAERFTKLDKNGDGVIDASERPERRGKRGKGGEGRGKGGPGRGGRGRRGDAGASPTVAQ
jgi:hypothetical protein